MFKSKNGIIIVSAIFIILALFASCSGVGTVPGPVPAVSFFPPSISGGETYSRSFSRAVIPQDQWEGEYGQC